MSFRIALTAMIVVAPFAKFTVRHPHKSAAIPKLVSVTQITRDGNDKTNLFSDGKDLYVTESSSTGHVVAKFSLSNSNRSLVASNFSDFKALDLSPDRNSLLVTPVRTGASESEFWALPINTGVPHKLAGVVGHDASWSPDGRQLAFVKGSTLSVASADMGAAHDLYTADGSIFMPRYSPDGRRIRFSIGNPAQNTTTLWEIGADGSDPHPILANWRYASTACCGSWNADGTYYVFQVTQSSPSSITTLWTISEHGKGAAPVQLTDGPISFGNARPANDNNQIWAVGVKPEGQPVKYNPSSKSFSALISGVSATDLDFSPDGKWVTYVAVPEGTLWKSRADGSESLQLTFAPERAALPHWSPDSSSIGYVSIGQDGRSKIVIISGDRTTKKELFAENRNQIDANWSSDGKRIMFGYLHDTPGLDIRIVDLSNHEITSVPGSEGLFSPRWSPNGRYIAALSPDFTKVMLFDFNSQKWSTWLEEVAGAVSYPVWSADSRYLYFDDLVTDEESIRRVKVGESRTERVFKLEGIERYPGPFGLWSARTADGSWMFVRDHSTQEVYRLDVELP
jgi:Tol biopolymer transport system component